MKKKLNQKINLWRCPPGQRYFKGQIFKKKKTKKIRGHFSGNMNKCYQWHPSFIAFQLNSVLHPTLKSFLLSVLSELDLFVCLCWGFTAQSTQRGKKWAWVLWMLSSYFNQKPIKALLCAIPKTYLWKLSLVSFPLHFETWGRSFCSVFLFLYPQCIAACRDYLQFWGYKTNFGGKIPTA